MQYRFGDYALDTRRCELRRTGRRIPLRPKVFDVLRYLIAHRDRVIAQQELLEHLWPDQFVGDATLKSCIKEARRAVGDTGQAQRCIQTLHGRGYRFVATVAEASEYPAAATRAPLAPPRESAAGTAVSPNAAPAASAPEALGLVVEHPPVPGREAHARVESRDTVPDDLEGERKQVTILCCGLVDARGLAAQVGQRRCIASCGPSWPWRSAWSSAMRGAHATAQRRLCGLFRCLRGL